MLRSSEDQAACSVTPGKRAEDGVAVVKVVEDGATEEEAEEEEEEERGWSGALSSCCDERCRGDPLGLNV
jgi:hypothetical protein